ncbi:MAG: PilZ domain-containing protein [Rhodospirillales bacterium]
MGVPFRLTAGAFHASGITGDLSPNGALLVAEAPDAIAGADGELELEGIGRLNARVVAASPIGIHVMFRDVARVKRRRLSG